MARVQARKACLNCRRSHLKCDQELPSCRRCTLSNLSCEHPVSHSFRRVKFNGRHEVTGRERGFSAPPASSGDSGLRGVGQQSPQRESSARFVDETTSAIETQQRRDVARPDAREDRDIAGETSATGGIGVTSETPVGASPPRKSLSPSASYFFNNPPSIIGLPLSSIIGLPSVASVHHVPVPYEQGSYATATPMHLQDVASVEAAADLAHAVPSITHPREAYLLKVFTQTWGPIFDCLDADLTFTKSVLHIALTSCQPLFWAILATSALQLSRVS